MKISQGKFVLRVFVFSLSLVISLTRLGRRHALVALCGNVVVFYRGENRRKKGERNEKEEENSQKKNWKNRKLLTGKDPPLACLRRHIRHGVVNARSRPDNGKARAQNAVQNESELPRRVRREEPKERRRRVGRHRPRGCGPGPERRRSAAASLPLPLPLSPSLENKYVLLYR